MKRLTIALFLCLLFSCRLITEPQELTIIREIIDLAWIRGYNSNNKTTYWYLSEYSDEILYQHLFVMTECKKITLYLIDNFFIYIDENNIEHRVPIQGYGWSWKKL